MTETSAPPAAPPSQHSGRARAIACVLVFILAIALTPIGMVAYWGHRTVTDTQRYLETVAPLAYNQEVQDSLSTFITEKIDEQVNPEQMVNDAFAGLIEKQPALKMLVPVVAGAINALIAQVVDRLVRSEEFANLWAAANMAAQKGLMAILEGNDSGPVTLKGDEVVLDISQVIDAVKQGLVEKGFDFAANINVPDQDRYVVLFTSPQLAQIRTIYSFTSPIASYLVLFVFLLFLIAIFLARRRPRMVAWTGGAVLINGILLAVALNLGQQAFVNTLSGTPFAQASQVFYDTLLRYLIQGVAVTILIGIILLACGLYLCNARWAVRLRASVNGLADRIADSMPAGMTSSGAFVAKYARWIRVAIAVLFAIITLAGSELSLERAIWTAVISLVLLAVVQIWAACGRRTPQPTPTPVAA